MATAKTVKVYNNMARLAFLPPLSVRTAGLNGGDGKARNQIAVVPGQFVEVETAHINALIQGHGKEGVWYHKSFVDALNRGDFSIDEADPQNLRTPGSRRTLIRANDGGTWGEKSEVDALSEAVAATESAQASKVAPRRR